VKSALDAVLDANSVVVVLSVRSSTADDGGRVALESRVRPRLSSAGCVPHGRARGLVAVENGGGPDGVGVGEGVVGGEGGGGGRLLLLLLGVGGVVGGGRSVVLLLVLLLVLENNGGGVSR
jgi:hypothetical protein